MRARLLPVHGLELLSLDEIRERCERVLSASPADATTLVWMEIGRAAAATGRRRRDDLAPPARERSVLVRVEERGRVGFHRTGAETVGELENALRCALGQARVDSSGAAAEPTATAGPIDPAHPPASGAPAGAPAPTPGSFDPELARLSPGDAAKVLQRSLAEDERADLAWAQAHVVVADSHGLRRAAAVTAATLTVRAGPGRAPVAPPPRPARWPPSAPSGSATGPGPGGPARQPPALAADAAPTPIVVAPEAVVRLVDLLNRHALFAARSLRDGSSALAPAHGERLFDPALTLRDDGTDPDGLPFPFDLAGAAKRPFDLVTAGVVATPAVDDELAADRGPVPTPHPLVGDEARAENLFLLPSQADDGALASAAAGDGLWIGWLDRVECFDPPTLRFRARARGVRRLIDGVPGPAVGDLVWEDSLLRLFSEVAGVGSHPVVLATDGGILGAVSAPAVAFPAAVGLRPLE